MNCTDSGTLNAMDFKCFHYDIASGAYLKPEVFKKALKLAADSGFTHFLPYLESMIRLTPMERACPDCAYTPEQWRDFDDAAAKAGIELIPHFNVIGHSARVCRNYPEFAGRPGEHELDVTLPVVRQWATACLDEFCAFSKGRYFLIGGDEWQPPRHLLADPDFNVARVWADQINLACHCLAAKGRSPIVWHDMLTHYPEALDLISRDAVIAFWFYDEDSDYPFLDMLKTRGFKTIMASGIGTCSGLLARRQQRAVDCAIKAATRHKADGFMMTTWGDTRWEKMSLTIPTVGALLRGDTVQEPFINTASILETINKLPAESRFAGKCRAQLASSTTAPVWTAYPEFFECLSSVMVDDPDREGGSFLRYHEKSGPLLESIEVRQRARAARLRGEAVSAVKSFENYDQDGRMDNPAGAFRLVVEEKAVEGPTLRFVNGEETFVIYPRFGASLQDWRLGSNYIISHSLPGLVRKGSMRPPGGFASYSDVLGFRPIWGLGTHSCPCILWQGPFDWKSIKESDDTIAVELARRMPHVDVRYVVTARKGTPGFIFQAEARNLLKNAYGAFSFNLPLSTKPQDLDDTAFKWLENGKELQLRLSDQFDSLVRLPGAAEMTVEKPGYSLRIECDPDKTAGFYVDWSASHLTPDARGRYRKLSVGECESVKWKFSASPRME